MDRGEVLIKEPLLLSELAVPGGKITDGVTASEGLVDENLFFAFTLVLLLLKCDLPFAGVAGVNF